MGLSRTLSLKLIFGELRSAELSNVLGSASLGTRQAAEGRLP